MTQYIERAANAAMRHRVGMESGRRAELKGILEGKNDWSGRCQECGERITGTLADLREHHHAPR